MSHHHEHDPDVETIGAILRGSRCERRTLHPTTPPCWTLSTGRWLPNDPECQGRCNEVVVEAEVAIRRRLGAEATADAFERSAPAAVAEVLVLDGAPRYEVSLEEQLVAVLRGSTSQRRRFHGVTAPCRAALRADGRLQFLPEHPVCDGACGEVAAYAVGLLRRNLGHNAAPGRLHQLAGNAVEEAVRVLHAELGLYVRLDRLAPAGCGTPRWYLRALPNHPRARHRAHALLQYARNEEDVPPTEGVWPLHCWAEEDGLSVEREAALVEAILTGLAAAKPTFLEDNVDRPLARKRMPILDPLWESGDGPRWVRARQLVA